MANDPRITSNEDLMRAMRPVNVTDDHSIAHQVRVTDTRTHRAGPDLSGFTKHETLGPQSVIIPFDDGLVDVGGMRTDAATAARLEKAGMVTTTPDLSVKAGQSLAPSMFDAPTGSDDTAADYGAGADPEIAHPMDREFMTEMQAAPVGVLAPYLIQALRGNQPAMSQQIKTLADIRGEDPEMTAFKIAKVTDALSTQVRALIAERGLDVAKVERWMGQNPETTASTLMRALQSGKVRQSLAPLLNRAPR